MGLETNDLRKRRQLLDKLDREIIRDMLSIVTLQVTISSGIKHSRSEALREVLLKHYEDKPEVVNQIKTADKRREIKEEA